MTGSLLRGGAAVAAFAAALGLASALTACASGTGNTPVGAAGAGSGTSTPSASAVPSASASPSPSAAPSTAPSTVNPGGPMSTTPSPTPPIASAPPAKSKYVPIEQETRSSDGRTLYLQIEAHGGACGQYVVVLQETTANVDVGMAQLEPKVGVMCPMYIGPRTFTVKLPSPVGTRTVIDLATGKPLGS